MLPIDDLEKAKVIVKQFLNPSINSDSLEHILESSKSNISYRPYWTAAFFINTHYQRIEKADDISWGYQDTAFVIAGLLNMQSALDVGAIVPAGFEVESLQGSAEESAIPSIMVIG